MKIFIHYLHQHWILICAVLFGACIRLWAGVHQPIYSEEAFSIFESKYFPFPYDPSYPPLYPLFLTQWTKISTHLLWVRLPNIIAGTLSIVVFWRMIMAHLNKKTADLGAIFIALSSLHIHYSWVARPHAFMMFIALLSLWQLWDIADTVQKNKSVSYLSVVLYLFTNTIGALISHGYTMFLLGSMFALLLWTWKHHPTLNYWKTNRHIVYIFSLHCLLPFIQLSFIGDRLQPLIDSAAWIPEFSVNSIISVLLTLTNTTKTLTGEMFASALISIYVSLAAVYIIFRTLYAISKTKMPFIALLSICVIIASILSCALVFFAFDMTVLQPRLLLPMHILYVLSLSVALPVLADRLRHTSKFSSATSYEILFIGIFLAFGVRSIVLLNINPFYNSPRVISAIQQLKAQDKATVLVFPRYEIITVNYLWGIAARYTSLQVTDDLLTLSDNAPVEAYLHRIPLHTPIRILLLAPVSTLSPGSQEIIRRIKPLCDIRHVDSADILSCPPLIHEL